TNKGAEQKSSATVVLGVKMASQCKKQQCSIDRRGFRQELDSWRHKLIHCVGFESILEGLFGTELEEDLKFFKGKHSMFFNYSKCCTYFRDIFHLLTLTMMLYCTVWYPPPP
uniref:Uncharacterized protein n=1 Tax=Cynoglossus semilaevis TaxID=244447 RepID=A0A3P8V323_CYNSE